MIAASSWFLCTLIGLGLFPALLFFARREWAALFTGRNLVQTLALLLMLGLLTDHALGLVSGDLGLQAGAAWAGLAGFAAAAALAAHAVWTPRTYARSGEPETRRRAAIAALHVVAAATMIVVSLAVFASPITDWDARSIWFFHGKAIFFDRGLHPSGFWRNGEYFWSHTDYPKLTPMLAARCADFVLGAWNEYAPKGALVPLAVSGIAGFMAVCRTGPQLLLLLLAVPAVLGHQLWNGYQDGWLAMHGCIAICALTRWSCDGERRDLTFGFAALGVALCLKNEGQLLLMVGSALFLQGAWRQWKRMRPRDTATVIVLAPFVLWSLLKPRLPAAGDLEGAQLIGRAVGMLADWQELTHRLAVLGQGAAEKSFLVESAAAYLILGGCVGLGRSGALLGASALLYGLGITAVYVGVHDFAWRVETSLDRVLMLPTLLLLAGVLEMAPRALAGLRLRTLDPRAVQPSR